jgi:4-amino-4-deoxy-L-arabinose transferase-like glycosyltransferase
MYRSAVGRRPAADASQTLRRLTRRITLGSLGLGAAWILFAWIAVPSVIRSAYEDGTFRALSGLMGGRDTLPVEAYLLTWSSVSWSVLVVLFAAWLIPVFALQPAVWRLSEAAYQRVPTFGGRVHRTTTIVSLVLLLAMSAMQAHELPELWESAEGVEYEDVARSLADGLGFSFPPGSRWLVLDGEPGAAEHGATAWKEPAYPYFMGVWFRLLGERYGRLAMVLFQVACLAATAFLVYRLGSLLHGPGTGAAAAFVTVSIPGLHRLAAGNLQISTVSGLLLVSILFMLFRYEKAPSNGQIILLGILLGFSALTHALIILLVPLAAGFVLLHTPRSTWRQSARASLLVMSLAGLTIAPWTVRNYLEFGHVIPVQTGFGFFANFTNGYLAETYRPDLDACGDGSPPAWQADGSRSALRILNYGPPARQVWDRAIACVAERAGPAYFDLNEHERDQLHRTQFAAFVREEPGTFLELAAVKAASYLFSPRMIGWRSTVMACLGLIGAFLALRRPGVWIFPAVWLAFTGIYSLTAPQYLRYRAPLEPVFALMAVMAVVMIMRPAWQRVTTLVRDVSPGRRARVPSG